MTELKKCPVCESRGKPCERFVSAAPIFKHYGVPPAQLTVRQIRRQLKAFAATLGDTK